MKLGSYELGPNDTPENGIYTGDARELAEAIPNESVDLILTDPPYQVIPLYEWLGQTGYRILKDASALMAFFATGLLPETLTALSSSGLQYRWLMNIKWAGNPILYGRMGVYAQRALWLQKGAFRLHGFITDSWLISQTDKPDGRFAQVGSASWAPGGMTDWAKSPRIMAQWLDALALPDGIIFEPFCGSGTTVVSCKRSDRRYLAFEIDPDTAERARERVRNTQPPLFTIKPEQIPLGVGGDDNG